MVYLECPKPKRSTVSFTERHRKLINLFGQPLYSPPPVLNPCASKAHRFQVAELYAGAFPYSFDFLYWEEVGVASGGEEFERWGIWG